MTIHKKKPTKKPKRPVLPIRFINHSLDPALSRFKQYLPVQRTWQPTDTVSADELNQNVRDATNFLLSPPRVHVQMNNLSQSIQAIQQSGVGMTPLTFDTLVVDSDNMWDSNVPSRFNFNTPGLYKWRLYVHWGIQNANAGYFIGLGRICASIWPIASASSTLLNPKIAEDDRQGLKSASVACTNYIEGFYVSSAQDDYVECFCSHTQNNVSASIQAAAFTARLIAQD